MRIPAVSNTISPPTSFPRRDFSLFHPLNKDVKSMKKEKKRLLACMTEEMYSIQISALLLWHQKAFVFSKAKMKNDRTSFLLFSPTRQRVHSWGHTYVFLPSKDAILFLNKQEVNVFWVEKDMASGHSNAYQVVYLLTGHVFIIFWGSTQFMV